MGCVLAKNVLEDSDDDPKTAPGPLAASAEVVPISGPPGTDERQETSSLHKAAIQEHQNADPALPPPAPEARALEVTVAAQVCPKTNVGSLFQGDDEREGEIHSSAVNGEIRTFQKAKPEAIDIDTILHDLEEEEETAEKFDAMLNVGQKAGMETFYLGPGAQEGGLEDSIFDPEFIEDMEEDLRRELGKGVSTTTLERGEEDMLFDPALIDSLEEELKEHASSKWLAEGRVEPVAVDPVKVSNALQALSQNGSMAQREQDPLPPVMEAHHLKPPSHKVRASGAQTTADTPATGLTASISRDGDSELWNAEGSPGLGEQFHDSRSNPISRSQSGTEPSSCPSPAVKVAVVASGKPTYSNQESALSFCSNSNSEVTGHMQGEGAVIKATAEEDRSMSAKDQVPGVSEKKGMGQGDTPAAAHTASSPQLALEVADVDSAAGQNVQENCSVSHETGEAAVAIPAKGLVAKPSAKAKILQKLESYKSAVESSQGSREVAGSARGSLEGEDRKTIKPGVVSRVKENWEKSQSTKDGSIPVTRISSTTATSSSGSTEASLGPRSVTVTSGAERPADSDLSAAAQNKGDVDRSSSAGQGALAPGPTSSQVSGSQEFGADEQNSEGAAQVPQASTTQPEPPPPPEDPTKTKKLTEAGQMAFATFEKRCPPGGDEAVVFYVTSVRAVRKTSDECAKVRTILQGTKVCFDERDVSQATQKAELKQLMGGACTVPQLFIRGYYIGDGESVINMHEDHFLEDLLEGIPRQRPGKTAKCAICAGKKFLMCKLCNGNHKVLGADGVTACTGCNEQGLVPCPSCSR